MLTQVAVNAIPSKTMSIMDSFVIHIFKRIAVEASRLAHYIKRSKITNRDSRVPYCCSSLVAGYVVS